MAIPISANQSLSWLTGLLATPSSPTRSGTQPGASFAPAATLAGASNASVNGANTSSSQLAAAAQDFLQAMKQSLSGPASGNEGAAGAATPASGGIDAPNSAAPASGHHHGHHHGGGSSWLTNLLDDNSDSSSATGASPSSASAATAAYALQAQQQAFTTGFASAAASSLLGVG